MPRAKRPACDICGYLPDSEDHAHVSNGRDCVVYFATDMQALWNALRKARAYAPR